MATIYSTPQELIYLFNTTQNHPSPSDIRGYLGRYADLYDIPKCEEEIRMLLNRNLKPLGVTILDNGTARADRSLDSKSVERIRIVTTQTVEHYPDIIRAHKIRNR